jgi:CDP-glucose 4,6-dehydratase
LLQLDCNKAKATLGWLPRLGFDDSVKYTADWYVAWKRGRDMMAFTSSQIAALRNSFETPALAPSDKRRVL